MSVRLVPAQPHESANALWAACTGIPPGTQPRPGLSVDMGRDAGHPVDLVVNLAVVDRQRPTLHVGRADHAVTLLAVTAGAATADDLGQGRARRRRHRAPHRPHRRRRPRPAGPDDWPTAPVRAGSPGPLPSLMTGSATAGRGDRARQAPEAAVIDVSWNIQDEDPESRAHGPPARCSGPGTTCATPCGASGGPGCRWPPWARCPGLAVVVLLPPDQPRAP